MGRDLDREDAEVELLAYRQVLRTLLVSEAFEWFRGALDRRVGELSKRAVSKRLDAMEYAELVGKVSGLELARDLVMLEDQRVGQQLKRLSLEGRRERRA